MTNIVHLNKKGTIYNNLFKIDYEASLRHGEKSAFEDNLGSFVEGLMLHILRNQSSLLRYENIINKVPLLFYRPSGSNDSILDYAFSHKSLSSRTEDKLCQPEYIFSSDCDSPYFSSIKIQFYSLGSMKAVSLLLMNFAIELYMDYVNSSGRRKERVGEWTPYEICKSIYFTEYDNQGEI